MKIIHIVQAYAAVLLVIFLLQNELRNTGNEIKTDKWEQKENVPPSPADCISHQEGEKVGGIVWCSVAKEACVLNQTLKIRNNSNTVAVQCLGIWLQLPVQIIIFSSYIT